MIRVATALPSRAPVVTIGMPVLNNVRTLDRAIASVRAQGFGDWLLIISDDGSTDGSDRIARAAAAADGRIRFLGQPQRLGFMNFRAPLDLAGTPYFAWLAGDDHWHPDFLDETLAALEAAPAALSALPEAEFIGPNARPVPNLGFLKGGAAERIRRYLAHPGGTRMYGLMRTQAARAAFPPRPFTGWDWYLMVALLAAGPQLSLPRTLLYREETPWFRYAEAVDGQTPRRLYRSLPVLEMSLQLIRDRKVPRGALPALAALNLRKHEEYVAVNHPAAFRRRGWLYRLLGLPIARNPSRQAELAARRAVPAAPAARPLTAILTFRNAGRTLGPALNHLHGLGCGVIAIDHGSTDDSRQIAAARLGAGDRLLDTPWTGAFDLGAQLAQKRDLIARLGRGWVLHADADEFLDPPAGTTLADCIAGAEAAGQIAFAATERLFLPRFEDEEHDSDSFPRSMESFVQMQEHDAKQRLFRADADLALWLRTGGHTVTRDPARLADTPLVLRHYPGLSLDDLRAQYLSRVFAPGDLARLWHGNRMAARAFDICAPDPTLFRGNRPATLRRLPFFVARADETSAPLPPDADLYALGDGAGDGLAPLLRAALPGLRVARVPVGALAGMTRSIPVLHVLRHPAHIHGHGIRRSQERDRAAGWTRSIALARQWALDRGAAYAEIRLEDAGDAALLRDRLVRLFRPPVLRGAAGFLAAGAAPVRRAPYENPVRAITAPLAADLGYV